MPNFSFLSGSNILARDGCGGYVVGGFTVIIMQVSVQIGLNLTRLELSLAISNKIWFELGLNFTNSSLNILILWGPCPSRNRTYESVISE